MLSFRKQHHFGAARLTSKPVFFWLALNVAMSLARVSPVPTGGGAGDAERCDIIQDILEDSQIVPQNVRRPSSCQRIA
jgi:hypothetical protein